MVTTMLAGSGTLDRPAIALGSDVFKVERIGIGLIRRL
jgi:hypothetical protein